MEWCAEAGPNCKVASSSVWQNMNGMRTPSRRKPQIDGQEPSVLDHAMGFEFHSKRNYEPLKGFKERVPVMRYMF